MQSLQLFTKSVEINATIATIVVYLAAAIFPNTIMASLEGVLISTRDVKFHSLSYLFTGLIMVTFQVRNILKFYSTVFLGCLLIFMDNANLCFSIHCISVLYSPKSIQYIILCLIEYGIDVYVW